MSQEQDEHVFGKESAATPVAYKTSPAPVHTESSQRGAGDESLAVLRQIEQSLDEIRGRVDTATRAHRHREFSVARLIGALLQALVVGFVIAALADWAYQAPPAGQLVKLAFAGVLELGALTAFVLARDGR